MSWTGPYVGALVLEVGHSTLRVGYSGDHYPSQIWPSSVGVGEDYEVFPVIPSTYTKVPVVEHLKYFDLQLGKPRLNKESYIRAVRGALRGRVHDKTVVENLKNVSNRRDLEDLMIMMGANKNDKDCWDQFSDRMVTGKRQKDFNNQSLETPSQIVKELHSFNSVTSGLGELEGYKPIFVVESNQTSRENRMLETEILFEELQVPGLHFGHGSQLAAYSVGLFSSVVIDVGSSTTSVALLADDEMVGYREYKVGGDHVDSILIDLLKRTNESNYSYIINHPEYNLGVSPLLKTTEMDPVEVANRPFTKRMPLNIYNVHQEIRTLKESILRVSFVPLAVRQEIKPPGTLPDGETFQVPEEESKLSSLSKIKGGTPEIPLEAKSIISLDKITPFQLVALSCEILFNPTLAYVPKNLSLGPFKGLVSVCEEMIKENTLYRREVFNQIALVGGMGIASGFQDRLGAEIARASSLSPQESALSGLRSKFVTFNSKVASRHASWIGASMISSLGSFHSSWISKAEYNEHGANITNRKGGKTKMANTTNTD